MSAAAVGLDSVTSFEYCEPKGVTVIVFVLMSSR